MKLDWLRLLNVFVDMMIYNVQKHSCQSDLIDQ